MTEVQTSAQVDANRIITRLAALETRHQTAGRISHAQGVRSALNLVRREMVNQLKAGRSLKPQN